MKETNNTKTPEQIKLEKEKKEALLKQKKKAETSKFKSKYFEYYDDIKISDRQDW